MNCIEKFEEIYRKAPQSVAFCPYRVCPLGAHTDHQKGKVTGFAIDKGIHIAFSPKLNGVVELASLQFDKRAQWHVRDVPEHKREDWADYLRGATLELSTRYPLRNGISGVIEGSLPIGGLSSSAAVTIAFISALCRVNDIKPSQDEIIQIALSAEVNYVGVSVGKLDQSCEVYCRADQLLYLDTQDDSVFEVGGYADKKTGSAKTNQKLSEKRAQTVYDALVAEGVDPSRLEKKAYGGVDAIFFNNDVLSRTVIIKKK